MTPLTQKELKAYVDYDIDTDIFIWKKDALNKKYKKGDPAIRIDNRGNKIITINQCTYPVHKLIWLWVTGEYITGRMV